MKIEYQREDNIFSGCCTKLQNRQPNLPVEQKKKYIDITLATEASDSTNYPKMKIITKPTRKNKNNIPLKPKTNLRSLQSPINSLANLMSFEVKPSRKLSLISPLLN